MVICTLEMSERKCCLDHDEIQPVKKNLFARVLCNNTTTLLSPLSLAKSISNYLKVFCCIKACVTGKGIQLISHYYMLNISGAMKGKDLFC